MTKARIHQFPCGTDNYGVLVHDPLSGATAAIDTPDASCVFAALEETGWPLTHILNTHHHYDHVGGNEALKQATGCRIVGPSGEAGRIPGLDVAVGDGDTVEIGSLTARVIATPGHTAGHAVYWFPDEAIAFTGDTMFSMGCGRLFEGSPAQMWASLQKIMALPPQTQIYCGHEYTLTNGEFALTVDPGNEALHRRLEEVKALRRARKPTLPVLLAVELETNPFLRPADPAIQRTLDMEGREPVEVFAEIRRLKDGF